MRTVAIGTEKGAWLLQGKPGAWSVGEPEFAGWRVNTFGAAPDGTWLAGVGSNWFGTAVHHHTGSGWEQYDEPPAYPADGPRMEHIWTFHADGQRLYAGVSEAGLFHSDDNGATWSPVAALNDHPTRADWSPGFGGLCAHRICTAGGKLWVGISAVGVFRSDDGGQTFLPRNVGIPAVDTPEGSEPPEVGYCVHSIAVDPDDPRRLWRQDHRGVFRSTDGADTWERIEDGLPSGFGFPIGRHDASGRLFVAPLHSDEQRLPVDGRFRVYRSDDDGDSWQVAGTGWSDEPSFGIVLRDAMDGDADGGVFVGTTSGEVWGSVDNGDSWEQLPGTYPRILTVAVLPG